MADADPIKCKICGAPSDGKCLYADPSGPKPPEDCRVRQIARELASGAFPVEAPGIIQPQDAKTLEATFKEILRGHEWRHGYIGGKNALIEELIKAVSLTHTESLPIRKGP